MGGNSGLWRVEWGGVGRDLGDNEGEVGERVSGEDGNGREIGRQVEKRGGNGGNWKLKEGEEKGRKCEGNGGN